jgi:hypothetical protein
MHGPRIDRAVDEGGGRKPPAGGRGCVGPRLTFLEDVTAATESSEDLQETLQRIVEVIAKRTSTDVCSITR